MINSTFGEAVDKVRRQEHKALVPEGYEDLEGSQYDWLYNPREYDTQTEIAVQSAT